ncbi:MAG: leucine-rich repeat domain-containing protein, partial [Clostridia bacterium]|nr:leucine-rich repeat domain-containing protein [Clostridia bacterium]
VTGNTVESDFKFINGNSINKPDLIFHHIPSFTVETELLELGYVKNYDYETGFTTYSVNGTLVTSYTPKANNNGVVNELQSGSFKYGLTNSGNAVITGYSGNENSISFPAEIDGYTVTALGDNVNAINIGKAVTIIVPDTVEYIAKNAFAGNKYLENVNFTDNLKIIEANAFRNCLIKEVILPQVKYVGQAAFMNCLPERISIPATLKEIPPQLFYCSTCRDPNRQLIEVDISEGVETIGPDSFCFTDTDLEIYGQYVLSLPSSIKHIGDRAFKQTAGKAIDLIIPYGIKKLNADVFASNTYSSITLPSSIEYIGEECFINGEFIQTVEIPDSVIKIDDSAFELTSVPEIVLSQTLNYIGNRCFKDSNIGNLSIPDSVIDINPNVFDRSYIGELVLPETLESFSSTAFSRCTLESLIYKCRDVVYGTFPSDLQIRNLNISESVRRLRPKLFKNINILGNITIMSGVEVIDDMAFAGSTIKEINLPNTVTRIGYNAFRNTQITELTVPESVSYIGIAAFASNYKLERVKFLSSNCFVDIQSFKYEKGYNYDVYPFENCPNLHEFVFNEGIKYIPDNLLKNCAGVESVTIPYSVTDIGSYTFANTNLKSIIIPERVESIGDGCFENCSKLETVVINGNVFLIGDNAFGGCDKIREIYIADSVKDIGRTSFSGCTSLETVYMSRNVVYIPERCFENCTALSSFTWEADSKLIGKLAFAGCTSLTTFNFVGIEKLYPNSFKGSGIGVASLGEARDEAAAALQVVEAQSFMNCPELQTVALGGNVNTVQTLAFANCENLETAIISDSVETISSDAFENCPKLTIYCSEDSYAYNYAKANNISVSTFVVEPIPNQRYTGKDIEPPVSVTVSGAPLSKGEDFKVKYSDNINVGTATVKVSGINTYKMFSSIVNFAILTRDISEAEIDSIADQHYTGSEITPALRVIYNGKLLREGSDYKVIYTNNTAAGKAKATVTGIGNFSGTTTAEFNITENGGETESPFSNAIAAIGNILRTAVSFIVRLFNMLIGLFR